jgi:hypothetical protein
MDRICEIGGGRVVLGQGGTQDVNSRLRDPEPTPFSTEECYARGSSDGTGRSSSVKKKVAP